MSEGSENATESKIFKILGELKSDTYFSKYGIDVILTIFILFIILMIFMYIRIQSNKNYYIYGKYTDKDGKQQPIWKRERCKPHILPFSGNLYRPDPSKSAFETTMNNFEECVNNPFTTSNVTSLNPVRFAANTVNSLLTVLSAIISGIRSYIQSVLDVFFIRFKENKEILTNTQIDITRRFSSEIYNKLHTSATLLNDSINDFTTNVNDMAIKAGAQHIRDTVKFYYREWVETLVLKTLGASLVSTAYFMYTNLGPLFFLGAFPHAFGEIFLGIAKGISSDLQPHYNVLSGAGEFVPAPVGGDADFNTDKQFSLFYGDEYKTETVVNSNGTVTTTAERKGQHVGGNISSIKDITKPSFADLLKAWDFFCSKNDDGNYNDSIWQKAINNHRATIRDIKGVNSEDANTAQLQSALYDNSLEWPSALGGDGSDMIKKKIKLLKRWMGLSKDVPANKDHLLWGKKYFIADNIHYSVRIEFKDNSYWDELVRKLELAKNTNCFNLNVFVDESEKAIILLQQDWKSTGAGQYQPEIAPWPDFLKTPNVFDIYPEGEQGNALLEKHINDDETKQYTTYQGNEDDITDPKQRLFASRMWFYDVAGERHIHRYDPGSARIEQGRDGSYGDGNITFSLKAWTCKDDETSFEDTSNMKKYNVGAGQWTRTSVFKNNILIDGECMSGCFGKNTLINMNDGKQKPINKIKPGDILENNNKVNGVMKCKKQCKLLYKINDTIVTSHHKILYNDKFIDSHKHPDSVYYNIKNYNHKYVYCLSTEQKKIQINNLTFIDWDELNEKDITKLKMKLSNEFERESQNDGSCDIGKVIHKHIDSGFHPYTSVELKNGTTKYFKDITCNDIMKDGSKINAIIKIDAREIDMYKHDINGNSVFGTQNLVYKDNHNKIKTTYYNEEKRERYYPKALENDKDKENMQYMYHMLTDSGVFEINNVVFHCYNKNLEIFL